MKIYIKIAVILIVGLLFTPCVVPSFAYKCESDQYNKIMVSTNESNNVDRWCIAMGFAFDGIMQDANCLKDILHNNNPDIWPLDHIKLYSHYSWDNIIEGLQWIESQEDENDITIWQSAGHGNPQGIASENGFITYNALNKEFDKFDGRLLIMICACGSRYAHTALAGENRIIITGRTPLENSPCNCQNNNHDLFPATYSLWTYFIMHFVHPNYGAWGNELCDTKYGNNDGWISAEEAFSYVEDSFDWPDEIWNNWCYAHLYITDGVSGNLNIMCIHDNKSPEIPIINGPTECKVKKLCTYQITSTYLDGYDISYIIDWGDNQSEEMGLFSSAEVINVTHSWEKEGIYSIKAKAKNQFGFESDWGTLEINLRKNRENNLLKIIINLRDKIHTDFFPIFFYKCKFVNEENEHSSHIYPIMSDPIKIDCSTTKYNNYQSQIVDTPSEFNWANYNGKDFTTSAKNQAYPETCGCCWDFGAIGALESRIEIMENNSELNPDLSEQYVLSCLPNAALDYGEGCDGGSPYAAYYAIMDTSDDGNNCNGVIRESCMPYRGSDEMPCSDKCDIWEEMLIPLKNCSYIVFNPENYDTIENRNIIKSEIYLNGPVASGMNTTYEFERYWEIHHGPTDYFPDPNEPWGWRLNHVVMIVGWKDDPNIDNGGYWICKNSWGTDWGYNGFFNIEYGGLFIDLSITWAEYDPNSYDWSMKPNSKPETPEPPIGSTSGKIKNPYEYHVTSTDVDNDQVYYLIDWGDETDSGWQGPCDSGETCILSHTWISKGGYQIRVKCKDIYGLESEWSDPLVVSMPKSKFIHSLFIHLYENHLIKLPLLRILFKLNEGV